LTPTEPEPTPIPGVEIIKGDGDAEAGTITNDANNPLNPVQYEDGETRDIVFTVENTGDEDLVDVVLTDPTIAGPQVQDLVWTLPHGEELVAEDVDGVLTAEWDGPWAVGDTITGVATLTLPADELVHSDWATVTAVGAESGIPVLDTDPYHAISKHVPVPTDPEEPTESGTPADPAGPSDQEIPGDEEDELSRTGANFALLFGALGLILLLTGGALYAR